MINGHGYHSSTAEVRYSSCLQLQLPLPKPLWVCNLPTPPLNKRRPRQLGCKANKRRVANRCRGRGAYIRMCVTIYYDLWPRALYHSTATVQTTHARLFVAVATLAHHAARCLPSITSLINLALVQCVQVI